MKMQKVLGFMKKNLYYLLLGVCILAIGTVVTVGVLLANKPSTPTGGGSNNNPNPNPDPDPTTVTEEIVFDVPVRIGTIGMDYSDSVSVYNMTMKREEMHKGIDFAADIGTNVYVAFAGTVVDTSYDVLFGAVVWVDHGDGLVTVYKSLSENLNVQKGNKLRKGDIIGTIGASLFEVLEGPHLHFETLKDGAHVSPYDYFLNSEK